MTDRSPYYPPRAGWSRHLYSAVHSARRHLHLENLNLPRLAITMSARRAALCMLLPGYSFHDAGWPRIGLCFTLGWLMAAAVFLMWLGHTAASIAFGLMMSLHVSGVLHFLNRVSPSTSVWRRLVLSLAVLFVVGQLIYAGGLRWFQNHLFMPLESNGKIYVVNPRVRPAVLHRGEWLAYRVERTGGDGVYIQGGFVLDRILAEPGDTLEFGSAEFSVNGVPHARLRYMPASGMQRIPEKAWFVWPSLRTVQRNNVSEQAVSGAVMGMALVGREQIIGRPYRRWFWRKQTS